MFPEVVLLIARDPRCPRDPRLMPTTVDGWGGHRSGSRSVVLSSAPSENSPKTPSQPLQRASTCHPTTASAERLIRLVYAYARLSRPCSRGFRCNLLMAIVPVCTPTRPRRPRDPHKTTSSISTHHGPFIPVHRAAASDTCEQGPACRALSPSIEADPWPKQSRARKSASVCAGCGVLSVAAERRAAVPLRGDS